MESTTTSIFRKSALASGLITPDQIEEAVTAIRRNRGGGASVRYEPTDQQLADFLVGQGPLNSWQAEQLLEGRSKFNLGPYRILDSIGQGGMGQVFQAEHTLMGRVVAIKVLPRSRSTPEAIEGFMREIRAQAQLDHENLVRAFDAGRDGNVHYLVTEFVPGVDLRRLVRQRNRLSMSEAASIIAQAARGLEHAHSRGLIHRDVKPGNLLVTPEGKTKLSDLGLAGFLDDIELHDPRAGKIVGTADYLSPEQILTPTLVTRSCDIYSLGCTLYYAVTGKVPFPGGTTRDKIRRHCEDTPLNPRHFNPDLDDKFLVLLCDMMEKDPRDRITSAEEVVKRLEPWIEGDFIVPPEYLRSSTRLPRTEGRRDVNPVLSDTLADTASGHLDLPEADFDQGLSSPSQFSQVTYPVASASQETFPSTGYLTSPLVLARQRRMQKRLLWLTAAFVGGALAILGTLLGAFLLWRP